MVFKYIYNWSKNAKSSRERYRTAWLLVMKLQSCSNMHKITEPVLLIITAGWEFVCRTASPDDPSHICNLLLDSCLRNHWGAITCVCIQQRLRATIGDELSRSHVQETLQDFAGLRALQRFSFRQTPGDHCEIQTFCRNSRSHNIGHRYFGTLCRDVLKRNP